MTTAGGPPAPARGGARRALAAWVVVSAASAGLVLAAAGRTWVRAAYSGGPGGGTRLELSGGELAPVLTPLALACLAAVVAVLATRGLWRKGVGVLTALLGAAIAVAAWRAVSPAAVAQVAGTRGALTGVPGLVTSTVQPWPALAVAGGALLTAAGALAVVSGGRWPGMSERYERRAAPAGTRAGAGRPGGSERSLWDALDRGLDPTEGDGPTGRPG
ncbi:hypothetical protein Sme01_32450 [Sphaerisporangium melleum]|uniref:TIGR02234 family membrane protein n=1 Tax=Sphaerisporangium melleum TaxID=321316 RepID=A0A917RIU4_9ACTN|nr:TIGR02234 family membrane protein [Sphaerisporangium melleum]GGL10194.1 hypothetical protein GCM10007964_60440 [Sphaerisporangium melleum]GII70769.1 hypothetical protein Sme01_32450 [Sphaerisporangium melleum]